jgi:hypothetical protein
MVRTQPVMSQVVQSGASERWGRTVALGVVLVLLTLLPFASALEIHHELAAADQDGHEHSSSDLCQWVQHHTGSSILTVIPPVAAFHVFTPHEFATAIPLLSVRLIHVGPSRAPPAS